MRHLAKRRSTFGVLLTRRHGWPKKFSGEMTPPTGPRVSVSRYRDQLKSYTSPGLVFAPLGAMPPLSTKRHCTRLPWVCHVPYPQVQAAPFRWLYANRPRYTRNTQSPKFSRAGDSSGDAPFTWTSSAVSLMVQVPSSGPLKPLALPASSGAMPSHVGTGSLSATEDTLLRNPSISARSAAVSASFDSWARTGRAAARSFDTAVLSALSNRTFPRRHKIPVASCSSCCSFAMDASRDLSAASISASRCLSVSCSSALVFATTVIGRGQRLTLAAIEVATLSYWLPWTLDTCCSTPSYESIACPWNDRGSA